MNKPIFELLKTFDEQDKQFWALALREESLTREPEEFLRNYASEPDMLRGGYLEDLPILDPENVLANMIEPVLYTNAYEWTDRPGEIKYFVIDEGTGE